MDQSAKYSVVHTRVTNDSTRIIEFTVFQKIINFKMPESLGTKLLMISSFLNQDLAKTKTIGK